MNTKKMLFLLLLSTAPAAARGEIAPKVTAGLNPVEGYEATAKVDFSQDGKILFVDGELTGLPADAACSVYIAKTGDCAKASDPAVERLNLGNIRADARGIAQIRFQTADLQLDGPRSVVGRALLIFEQPRNGAQTVGFPGALAACGIVKRQ